MLCKVIILLSSSLYRIDHEKMICLALNTHEKGTASVIIIDRIRVRVGGVNRLKYSHRFQD
jgi:hypothetical protein